MSDRIVIAGASSNVGKTTFTLGLMKALVKRGLKVQGFKVGPDYIDPAFHSHVTGVPSRNLDSWMIDEESIKYLFNKNSKGKDISVVEGVMGMYDGFSGDKSVGSTAHVSKILDAPVILLIDGSGIAASAAAIVLGYKMLDPEVDLRGVIINNVHGRKHYEILQSAIEKYTKVKCLGFINKNSKIKLESRHLGLIPSVEVEALDEKIDMIAEMVEETVDIDTLINIAKSETKIEVTNNDKLEMIKKYKESFKGLKIGVPMDSSFNFYYQDNLDLITELGAELLYFSPVRDKKLPDRVDALYIGGGFPEIFAKDLANNYEMTDQIRQAYEKGVHIYAECGGLMYLLDELVDLDGNSFKMLGLLSGKSIMTGKLQRFGYVEVETEVDTNIGNSGLKFRAHEFHRSEVTSNENTAYKVTKQRETTTIEWNCGYYKERLLAAYAHNHFYSNPEIIINFLSNIKENK